MKQHEILLRSQQKPENCWAVEDIYPTEEAWSQALAESASFPAELAAYQGRLSESAQTLLAWGAATLVYQVGRMLGLG